MEDVESHTNPFLEKTISNWLATTNELGYQMPFCQLLLSEGYTVCHNSKQNAFEQGKDIIAIDRSGNPCGFQLKGGNITNKLWRDEIRTEIDDLIDYQIVHPSIKKTKPHISFLVTNGEIEDTVRLGIDNLNAGKWKNNPLQVITGGELLNRFVAISNNFTPQEVTDYKCFLDLYFVDGRELISEEKYLNLIAGILHLNDDDDLPKAERKRNIAAAVLYSGYIVSAAKKADNHITILQVLSLLCAQILSLVEKYSLEEKYWISSFEIVWWEIEKTAQKLQNEIGDDGMVKMVTSIWDGEIGEYRRHLAVSYLLAFKCAQLINHDEKWKDILNDDFFKKLSDSMTLWGEGGLLPFIFLFFLLNKTEMKSDSVFKPLHIVLDVLIKFNGRESNTGILSPYYGVTTAIKVKFGLLDELVDEKFTGRSYIIKSIVDLLVRHGRRKDIERYWKEITYISQEEFLPKKTWMHFLWRCRQGESLTDLPKQTQSWSELESKSKTIELDKIPQALQKQKKFLPFFLLHYPHRITTNYIKFFDSIVNS